MVDLSIIIVNYNVKEYLLNLLDSIRKASHNMSVEIIVIDNNSDDDSISTVNEKYPSVITIENKENVGFGKANNQGLEISKGKYILLINPDTLIKEDTLIKMIDFLEKNPGIGLATCKVLNPDGSLQLPCRRSFPGPWVSFTKVTGLSKLFPNSKLFAKYNLTYLDENSSYEVDAVSGSFMMMSRKAYELTEGFDSDFFMYGEDLDLCYRIQKNNLKVFYYSNTEIIHYKGESTKRSKIDETKIFYDAMHLFVEKHLSSSFLVKSILNLGIVLRKMLAFINVNKFILLGILIDLISFSFLIRLSEYIYATERWPGFPEIFKPWVYILPSIFIVLISLLSGAYKRDSLSVMKSLASLTIGFIFITSITFFLKQYAFSRAVVLITFSLSAIFFSLWRIIFKYTFLRHSLVDESMSNAVVVGTDSKSLQLTDKLTKNYSSPYNIVGFIGQNIDEIGKKIKNVEIIGAIGNVKKAIIENNIQNVIFPSDSIEFDKIFSIVSECQGENINFLISGNELDYMVGKSNITHIENVPLLKVNYNISKFSHRSIKRAFDIVASSVLLIFLYPFTYWFARNNPKKTFFKKIIINLPQVLTGAKSFVGPRKVEADSTLYLGAEGITGLWYIENISEDDKNENRRLDLFYAKNQNIWLDLEIIGKSIAKKSASRRNNG